MIQYAPYILTILTAVFGYLFGLRNNNAEARLKEIEREIKAADFYKNLLNDAKRNLDEAITAINERDIRIRERDKKIELLIFELETLTSELRKYKQLNGKL